RMGARVEAGRRLPDGGPRRYLHALRETRARLERSIANPALNSEERELLARIPATLDRIEDSWDTLARATARLPETVVHSDFRPKNARTRREETGPVLYALDWEMAGWGVPVAAMEWETLSLHFEDPACLSTPVSSLRSLHCQLKAVLDRAPEWLE